MKKISLLIAFFTLASAAYASKLVSATILDKDYIMLYFRDGDVTFNERAIPAGPGTPAWPLYHNGPFNGAVNTLVTYGADLNTATTGAGAGNPANWRISSTDDSNFGETGVAPSNVHRKSKLGCMAQTTWNMTTNDWNYSTKFEHTLYLRLPQSMTAGKTYTIQLPTGITFHDNVRTATITFDIFNSRSEAVKVNIVGYSTANSIKAADVYMWMGNGGQRDYASFVGKKVYVYNTVTKESTPITQALSLWRASAAEQDYSHQIINTNVWRVDFTGFNTPGTYRLAVEDIGCSDEFTISPDIYYEPYKVSTQGFYYMRIGEDSRAAGMGSNPTVPVTRQPLYIPGKSPAGCSVIITSVHQYQTTNWNSIPGGDKWDEPGDKANAAASSWNRFATGRTNPNAYGGHSDAADWDRHLGHVCIIYDMLLPYFLSNGRLSEDNLGIGESGNGIPDIIDEAQNEVDFWLRLRDGMGYSHGLTCPTTSTTTPVFFQAGNTGVAAWAAAASAAMLGDCYRILWERTNLPEHEKLMERYRDSAIVAYTYVSGLSATDQMLTQSQGMGSGDMTGRCLRATAAAFLYNLTGDVKYENDLLGANGSRCNSNTSVICNNAYNEIYAVAGYLFTNRTVNNTARWNNMRASIIADAKNKETNFASTRPSRRSTCNSKGWFITEIYNQRTILAHAIATEGSADKRLFEDALILEADFSLGRNPLNTIHMTTATTGLADKRSFENAYTSGWNDGTPGVHPGHTPYMNIFDWGGLIMGRPKWMVDQNFPAVAYQNTNSQIAAGSWPYGELYYNTRYVYAANEFTPQQTMRGKQALYSYLYAIRPEIPVTIQVATPTASVATGTEIEQNSTITLSTATADAKIYYTTNGSEPSAINGTEYTAPVAITANVTIKAIAVKADMDDSEIAEFKYTVIVKPDNTPVITILTHPAPLTVVEQNKISGSLSVAASVTESVTLRYQWYSNTTNSNVGGTLVTGATNANFTIPTNLTAGTYYYFCVVSAPYAVDVHSNVATVTVEPPVVPIITILTQPAPQTVVAQGAISGSLSVTASVTPSAALTYQWHSSTTNSNTGNNPITGATNATFTIPTNLGNNTTTYYFCVVSATGATPVRSNVAEVTVSNANNTIIITISQQPVSVTVTEGSISDNLSVTATANRGNTSLTISYQWYSNTTNSSTGGTAITGATNAAFEIPTDLAAGTHYYYCVLSATFNATTATMNTIAATVTVESGGTTPPVITINAQPAALTTVTEGSISGSLTIGASATPSATVSYQWFSNTSNSNTGGTPVATGETFVIPTTLTVGPHYYYCVVSATGGATSVTSNVAIISVEGCNLTAGITNNSVTTVLTCTTPTISLTATGGATYSWSGSLGNTANATVTAQGTYTVTVTADNGCTATASITIDENNPLPTAGINPPATSVLTCSTPSITLTATGNGTFAWNHGLGSNATVDVTSAGTYTVTVTGANGCQNTASITISAEQTEYTVSFDDGSGNEVLVKPACQGVTITKPEPDPTRRGYNFLGWYQGSVPFDFGTLITAPVTLTAKWDTIHYNITYILDGGVNHPDNPSTYNVESNTITLQNPTKDNYDFVSWMEGDEIPASSIDAKTFTAQWTLRVGITEVSANKDWMSVTPNPVRAGESFRIILLVYDSDLRDCNITIYSLLGEKVYENHQLTTVVEVSGLSQGYYIVQLSDMNNKYRQIRKVIVE